MRELMRARRLYQLGFVYGIQQSGRNQAHTLDRRPTLCGCNG